MPDNKMPEDGAIILTALGLPVAKNPDVWDRLPDAEKAAILSHWSKTWSQGGSAASGTSVRRSEGPSRIVLPREATENQDWKGAAPLDDATRASLQNNDWK